MLFDLDAFSSMRNSLSDSVFGIAGPARRFLQRFMIKIKTGDEEPDSPSPEVVFDVREAPLKMSLFSLEQCPVVDDVLVLIQVIPYQEIRMVVNLGTDQIVITCCLQVCDGPEIFLVNII